MPQHVESCKLHGPGIHLTMARNFRLKRECLRRAGSVAFRFRHDEEFHLSGFALFSLGMSVRKGEAGRPAPL
jgi:hypothetical protein